MPAAIQLNSVAGTPRCSDSELPALRSFTVMVSLLLGRVGAERRRGARDCDARVQAIHRPADCGRARRAVRRPSARLRKNRQRLLRLWILALWFVVIAIIGVRSIAAVAPAGARGVRSASRHSVFHGPTGGTDFPCSGAVVLCLTGGEALPVRGYGALRSPSDPARLVHAGVFPACTAQLPPQREASCCGCERCRATVLPVGTGIGAVPAVGRPRDGRDSDRIAGPHHRRLLAHQPGGATRAESATPRGAHVVATDRSDLFAGVFSQLDADVRTCLSLVVGFGSSTRLAAAFGLAVSGTMAITTVLFMDVARTRWRWSRRA